MVPAHAVDTRRSLSSPSRRPGDEATQSARGAHFPYILFPTQEVRVYFVAMITLRQALVHERSTYVRSVYHVCDHITFSIHTPIARLYGAPVISAYGAGPPKVIGSWR